MSVLTDAGRKRLPAGDIVYWLRPSLRKEVLPEVRGFTMQDVYLTLHGDRDVEGFSYLFMTSARLRALANAFAQEILISTGWGKQKRPTQYSWLLGDATVARVRSGRISASEVDRVIRPLGRWTHNLPQTPAPKVWLPLASLESLTQLRKLTASEWSSLSVALGKTAVDSGLERNTRPWDGQCDPLFLSRPVTALFAHAPDRRSRVLIERFMQVGMTNIGHLQLIHPELWRTIKKWPADRWIQVAVKLRQLG